MNAPPDQGPPEERLGEVLAAYLEAVDAGWAPEPKAFLNRYPDLTPELQAFFSDQDQVARLADSLGVASSPTEPKERSNGWPEAATLTEAGSAPSTDPNLASVRYFGDYEILEEIAHGGMGIVFKARQRGLSRLVALKMILAGEFASPMAIQRFLREAENASHLDHPNIVPIYTVGEVHGQHYFTMKLIEGGNLSRHLPRFSTDLKAGVRVLVTVAGAVHYAHQRGILHRDLKPANILLDATGQPHITDFGLAKRIPIHIDIAPAGTDQEAGYVAPEQISQHDGRLTTIENSPDQGATLSAIAGTPSYMPPEQATPHRGGLTTAADVYSLGAILYKMLTGHAPFRGATLQETLEKVREQEPEPPRRLKPKLSRDLEAICLKCLDKKPEKRYASAQALAEDLQRWLKGEPVISRRRPWPARAWRAVYRHALLCALMAAAGFAAGALVLFSYLTDPERPLRAELRQLDRGQPVTLIGETGGPAWSQWMQGEDSVMVSPAQDQPFLYTTLVIGRLQLLPRTPASGYRFSAEVRQDDAYEAGDVGLFFAETTLGQDHYWCELAFADQGPASQFPAPPGDKSTGAIGLRARLQRIDGKEEEGPSYTFRVTSVAKMFSPEPNRWRSLAVEVRPDGIRAWWDGEDFGDISDVEIRKLEFGVRNPAAPARTFVFDPRGGLGLSVSRGRASFRNVRVEPLP